MGADILGQSIRTTAVLCRNTTRELRQEGCETTSTKEVCIPKLRIIGIVTDSYLGIIQSLQHLHDELKDYKAPPVVKPSLVALKPASTSVFGRLFGSNKKEAPIEPISDTLPRGLYLYGDVGSGKTMLMDLFYDTLPSSVTSKTRIHFHNFMQDVHKRLHVMKMEHGNDMDCIPFIAADIAEKGNVLCFDEFQCTDVADAMILRRSVILSLLPDRWLTLQTFGSAYVAWRGFSYDFESSSR